MTFEKKIWFFSREYQNNFCDKILSTSSCHKKYICAEISQNDKGDDEKKLST